MKWTWWLLPLLVLLIMLSLFQDRLTYLPRSYPFGENSVPAPLQVLRYHSTQGRQFAFWLPPADGAPPERIWLLFGGNASLALDWLQVLPPPRRDGYLLLDYPGYGFSQGNPSASSILQGAEQAYQQLAKHLHSTPEALGSRLALLGHSIGSGVALRFAQRYRPQRLVLVSPFTSLSELAQFHYGAWVALLVRNDYDNVAALESLKSVPTYLIHGSQDDIVPMDMGRQLAHQFPWIRYSEIAGAGHNDIFDKGMLAIRQAMSEE